MNSHSTSQYSAGLQLKLSLYWIAQSLGDIRGVLLEDLLQAR